VFLEALQPTLFTRMPSTLVRAILTKLTFQAIDPPPSSNGHDLRLAQRQSSICTVSHRPLPRLPLSLSIILVFLSLSRMSAVRIFSLLPISEWFRRPVGPELFLWAVSPRGILILLRLNLHSIFHTLFFPAAPSWPCDSFDF